MAASFEKVKVPSAGQKITIGSNGKINVPDQPILCFIEGDGTGPDIWAASQRVFDAAVEKAYKGKRRIQWCEIYAGDKAVQVYDGQWLPDETLKAMKEFVVSIKGPLGTPVGKGIRSLNVAIRKEMDLYACVRPVKWYEGVPSPVREPEKVNMVIFRENTEDVYAGVEFAAGSAEANEFITLAKKYGKSIRANSAIGVKPMSEFGSRRLMKKAMDYAIENKFKTVTSVHKGNIMKFTEGAFKDWCYAEAKEKYSDFIVTEEEVWNSYGGKAPNGKIVINDRIADNMFQQALLRPEERVQQFIRGKVTGPLSQLA